ncbi:MAG: alpha-1,2-fucosyltransferase [Terriglobia bacterium]
MVTVKLTNGLGNQMFQYALGRTIAQRRGTSLALDVSSYRYDKSREYSLGIFKIAQKFGDFPHLGRVRSLGQGLRLPGFAFNLGRVRIPGYAYVVTEKTFAFDPTVLDAPRNVWLDGFWQSEKYFKEIAPIIREDFALHSTDAKVQKLAERIQSSESVCINVRRGDYVTSPDMKALLGFVGAGYYAESMKIIHARVKNPAVFVFSDEIDWCTDNLRFDCPATFVGHEYAGEKFRDYLYLMTLCKHFIIPNSTFGWWAAWLSNSKGIVVAPKKWFNKTEMDTGDLIPAGWVQV